MTDPGNVGGGGTLFQWQALEKEEFNLAISQWGTDGLNRHGTLKHTTLTTNETCFPWAIETGNETKPGVTTLPMSENCSRVCWCYPLSPDCWGATVLFGYVPTPT